MADFDWKKLVGGIAPILGTALGGPLAGEAISMIGNALGLGTSASASDVASAIASGQLTGDQIVAMKQAENDFTAKMRALDIDVMKVNQAADAALIADTADARHTFGSSEPIFVLGVCILLGFVVLMGATLAGCFALMTGYFHFDPTVATFSSGLIGTVVGYVAANAQQVVSFYFGSSKGSKDSGDRIGQALTESIKQAGAK